MLVGQIIILLLQQMFVKPAIQHAYLASHLMLQHNAQSAQQVIIFLSSVELPPLQMIQEHALLLVGK